jgi:sugar fermentation stimulation protein A
MRVWLSRSGDPKRKLAWSWELVEADGGLVGVNTAHPNRIVEAALRAGKITPLAAYGAVRREVAYGQRSRVDFLLLHEGLPDCYVEVKNVHLRQGDAACFPDSVTARGARHLAELGERRRLGDRAVMLFLVQRGDCRLFRSADWIDPTYGRALRHAMAAGVETLCYACHISVAGIELADPMPIALDQLP